MSTFIDNINTIANATRLATGDIIEDANFSYLVEDIKNLTEDNFDKEFDKMLERSTIKNQ